MAEPCTLYGMCSKADTYAARETCMDLSYILLRIRARPACDRPLHSNGDRVAHRTDNSVRALLELTPEIGHGQGFNPAPSRPRTIRAG